MADVPLIAWEDVPEGHDVWMRRKGSDARWFQQTKLGPNRIGDIAGDGYVEVSAYEFAAAEQQPGELARVREELRVTEELLAERQRVLDAIPPCPRHGSCVPHALEWVEAAKVLRAGLTALEQEMRSIQLVAGQCSVEGAGVAASMAGAEAERCREWADRLAALRDGREARR